MTDEIWSWSATTLARAIRHGRVSSREAVEACRARVVDHALAGARIVEAVSGGWRPPDVAGPR